MKQKIYSQDIHDEIQSIADILKAMFESQKSNLRTIAKFSAMSINSVKAVLNGKTGNIASYSLVAKALGSNLIDVCIAARNGIAVSVAPALQEVEESNNSSVELGI